ncbi:MAG TPA: hypothetical protein PLQ93_02020 [Bacteroidia bacterium]|nr:hypothetical protein [Bacteroidia bacterium]
MVHLRTKFIFPIILICIGCDSPLHNRNTTEPSGLITLADSLGYSKITAAFRDGDDMYLLCPAKSDSSTAELLQITEGFPVFHDSLIKVSGHEYQSKRLRQKFRINDSEVIFHRDLKIIHPSSNWQGQSPWLDTATYTFKRVDRK